MLRDMNNRDHFLFSLMASQILSAPAIINEPIAAKPIAMPATLKKGVSGGHRYAIENHMDCPEPRSDKNCHRYIIFPPKKCSVADSLQYSNIKV